MIDRDQVQKVAHLARLELTDAEAETFTTQLRDILDYVEQLSELEVSEVAPTFRAIEVSNITRADSMTAFGDRESILDCAPDREGDFFKVPKIIAE